MRQTPSDLRIALHKEILENCLYERVSDRKGQPVRCPSNADKDSDSSIAIAWAMAREIEVATRRSLQTRAVKEQTVGKQFADAVCSYLTASFDHPDLQRKADYKFLCNLSIARFDQYSHLTEISRLVSENEELRSVLGTDYIIAPDIVMVRFPEPNSPYPGTMSPLFAEACEGLGTLIASISCKWSMRSDRAQNVRT